MITTITIKDTSATGEVKHQRQIQLPSSTLTIEEIIKARVYEEVKAYNEKAPAYLNSLVQPTETESFLNQNKLNKRRQIDAEQQYYIALDAFQKNGFFVLVDDRQISELGTMVSLKDHSEVSFIKLTPLVGG